MSFTNKKAGFSSKKNGGFSPGKGFNPAGSVVESPLYGIDYVEELGPDAAKEMTALQKGFKDRAQKERNRFKQATDSEFWFAVCFPSRERKEEFLRKAKIHKELMGDKYIDGEKLAKVLGVKLE